MKTSRAHLVLAVTMGFLAVAGTAAPHAAQAAIMKTYMYTGNTFTTATAPFTTSNFVSGSFTIDCGLAGGTGDCSNLAFADYAASITTFSFTAGPFTLTDADFFIFGTPLFEFSTDAVMLIDTWNISFVTVTASITTSFLGVLDADTAFAVAFDAPASVSANPGTWTFTTASVPEPSTLVLLLGGLVALLLLSGRRRAMAAWARGRPLTQQLNP